MRPEIVRRRADRRNPGQSLVTAAYIAVSAYMVINGFVWIFSAVSMAGEKISPRAAHAFAFVESFIP